MTDPTPTRHEAVPAGWKLVPIEPTPEMIAAGVQMVSINHGAVSGVPSWKAMIAAAPSAPAPASGGVDAVKVKALEWRSDQHDMHYADPDMQFTGYVVVRTGQRVTWRPSESDDWREASSLDDAKAEAQADFAFRLGSFLSPAATPGATEFLAEPEAWRWTAIGDSRPFLRLSGAPLDIGGDVVAVKPLFPAPAATPVSEAEPVAWRWRSRMKGGQWDAWEQGRYGAEVPPFMEVEEQYALAKPASSPAGGDVEAATIERQACAYLQFEAPPWVSNDYSKGFWDAIAAYRRAINFRSPLSQSTSAGRVGE